MTVAATVAALVAAAVAAILFVALLDTQNRIGQLEQQNRSQQQQISGLADIADGQQHLIHGHSQLIATMIGNEKLLVRLLHTAAKPRPPLRTTLVASN